MGELMNCPHCGSIFVKTNLRDVCEKCYKKEEKDFETVYQFIRKRENRTATLVEVVKATEVDEELITKFIRTGRLRLAQFPNLGYPCKKCHTLIREGNLCQSCTTHLRKEMVHYEEEEERKRAIKERDKGRTYFS
ncbi:TIGR03826 family flagellar region protein [Fredinandcohnia quinoae]|uniref:Flagellar associated protein n=1 Tax=Fredinandcohnia quinoae TaxID=2918902 RepID=A0AAW5E6P8_9BACI|nr:TIGR03826 family flagellar region protein [Fredinandcohnia sp. SECRCQ15]MCH1625076.1 hypothetical protein [Fredinandcohnia sp. SECRCQ15]